MGSYSPSHGQNDTCSHSRPPRRFTAEDDLFLVSWLARHNADGLGRRGIKTYKNLVQQHPTGTDLTPNGWKGRYIQNSAHFDPLIRRYIIDNLGSEATGSTTYIPPEIQPFTEEDETLLVEYLAKNADRRAKGMAGRTMYQRLSNNVEGEWPWAAKHSWYEWRNYYKTHSEKLDKLIEQYRTANNIKFERIEKVPRPSKERQNEEDCLLSGFIAEMKVKGAKPGSRLIYRALVNDEEGKWPWGKQHTPESWRSRYYQRREVMELLIQEKLAQIAGEPDTGIESISRSKIAGSRRNSPQSDRGNSDLLENSSTDTDEEPSALMAGSSMMEEEETGTLSNVTPPHPSSPLTSLISAKPESESGGASWPQESTSGHSFSRYSEPRPEISDPLTEAATMAVHQLPSYGLFTRQDDTVLLKYLLERSVDEKPEKKRRTGDLFERIGVFQELTKTVPAAGRHTAQTWRTRYLKNKMQFDRLVNQLKGPVERARRQSSSQAHLSISDSLQGIQRQIEVSVFPEEGGRAKKIRTTDKGKANSVKGKEVEDQGSSGNLKLMDAHDEVDTEEEGEVAEYLCDMDER